MVIFLSFQNMKSLILIAFAIAFIIAVTEGVGAKTLEASLIQFTDCMKKSEIAGKGKSGNEPKTKKCLAQIACQTELIKRLSQGVDPMQSTPWNTFEKCKGNAREKHDDATVACKKNECYRAADVKTCGAMKECFQEQIKQLMNQEGNPPPAGPSAECTCKCPEIPSEHCTCTC